MKNALLFLLIIVPASVLVLLWDSPPEIFFSRQKTQVKDLPTADSYMTNTVTIKYSQEGYPAYTLEARNGLYFLNADRFELNAPNLLANSSHGDAASWHLAARTAQTTQGGQEVAFEGDVYAWQKISTGKNEMRTNKLIFIPQSNQARSDDRVELSYPDGKTTGVGLRADFDSQQYQLLSQVQGTHYAP